MLKHAARSANNILAGFPTRVRIVEVGPRDGLQNESGLVPTSAKVEFVQLLARAGFEEIEITSFVNPKKVPQLGDASEMFAALAAQTPVAVGRTPRYSALVPNLKGLERAIESRVQAISLFTAASESFTQRNIGMTIAESLANFRNLIPIARANGMRVRAYVSTAFVCPYEGPVDPARVIPVATELLAMGVDEVSIGDTLGHATPLQAAILTEALIPILPVDKFAYHFHDTRGFALANVLTALRCGVSIFDSSAGGVGGCPFAPGAAGNVATEDLLGMLDGMGIETGVNLAAVMKASRFLETVLDRPLPSKYLQSCSPERQESP